MKNRKVVVIFNDPQYDAITFWGELLKKFPPIGTQGWTDGRLDTDNEYEVFFDDYPYPSEKDPSWFAHKNMVVFLDENMDHNLSINSDTKQRCRLF